MEKLIYLFGDSEAGVLPHARADLRDALIELGSQLRALGARRVTLCVADFEADRVALVPQFNPSGLLDGVLSLWLESVDERTEIEALLAGLAKRFAGYLVTESVPVVLRDQPAAAGDRYPGVSLVTTFPKPGRLDEETFYARWHGSHTKLSLEIHPLTQYVRNAVARPLTGGAPPLRAIVSEAVESVGVLADPELFFGGDEGRKRAVEDLLSFVDLETMSTVVMSQYLISG